VTFFPSWLTKTLWLPLPLPVSVHPAFLSILATSSWVILTASSLCTYILYSFYKLVNRKYAFFILFFTFFDEGGDGFVRFLERAIEALSPEWAAKREYARAKLNIIKDVTNSGYSHH
jgi:hypothetical protein